MALNDCFQRLNSRRNGMPSPVSILTRWYTRNKRDLPWRKTRDPYKILVSEIMLQQTQVDRVIIFYTQWLKRFPSWRSLADARTDELLHAWAGLGYNRRALQLREAARFVVTHGVPKHIEEWKQLKGVGPYTAAAVHAIVMRERAIVIDTNVRRVIGRVYLGRPYPALADDAAVAKALETNLPKQAKYWEFPQILMDFGNAICTPKNPACASCPLRMECKTAKKFLSGRAGEKPRVASRETRHDEKPYPDRIYRGRILAAIREGRARTINVLGDMIDPTFDATRDDEWLFAMIKRLERDGMITCDKKKIALARN
jgi:A/G-specific adenine glycosylase